MTKKLEVGDVFIVPTGDGRAGVGQVVAKFGKSAYFFTIFDGIIPLEEAGDRAREIASSPVRFIALSMDAKIHAGHWTIVAQAPVDPLVPLPAYKEAVGVPPRYEIVDYSGKRRRPATTAEAAAVPNRKVVVAPVRLERALKATLGIEPWLDAFDELVVGSGITTATAFGAEQ